MPLSEEPETTKTIINTLRVITRLLTVNLSNYLIRNPDFHIVFPYKIKRCQPKTSDTLLTSKPCKRMTRFHFHMTFDDQFHVLRFDRFMVNRSITILCWLCTLHSSSNRQARNACRRKIYRLSWVNIRIGSTVRWVMGDLTARAQSPPAMRL